jgi:hypothetical protein
VPALVGRERGSLWLVELTMATGKSITKAQALRYCAGSRAVKSQILDAVCVVTGYHRDYARRVLSRAFDPSGSQAAGRQSSEV